MVLERKMVYFHELKLLQKIKVSQLHMLPYMTTVFD